MLFGLCFVSVGLEEFNYYSFFFFSSILNLSFSSFSFDMINN
jgi:hypothetical protein